MAGKIVLCDACDQFKAEAICEDCGMWFCVDCGAKHVCPEDDFPYTSEHDLAAWNQRVAEAWDLPQQKGSGGDGA